MEYKGIMGKFKQLFPKYYIGELVKEWRVYGKDSVLITLTNRTMLVFTYRSDTKWRLETSSMTDEDWKGGKRMFMGPNSFYMDESLNSIRKIFFSHSKPVRHQQTCPICGSKRVNTYRRKAEWKCKACWDKEDIR